MSKKLGVSTLRLSRSQKAAVVMTLTIGFSLGGAVSARAIDIAQILQQINQLLQRLQTFTEVRNIASLLGILQLPSPQEAKEAIAGTFGADNLQAVSGNLVGNIISVNTSNLAHEKIWSKQGQEEQQKIIDEAMGLDRTNVTNSDDSVREAAAAQNSSNSSNVYDAQTYFAPVILSIRKSFLYLLEVMMLVLALVRPIFVELSMFPVGTKLLLAWGTLFFSVGFCKIY